MFQIEYLCFRKQIKWEESCEVSLCHSLRRGATKWSFLCGWMLIPRWSKLGIWARLYAPVFVFSAAFWQTPAKHRLPLHTTSATGNINFCLLHTWIWWIWYQHLFHVVNSQTLKDGTAILNSVKPQRERRGGPSHLSSAPLCLTSCQCSPAVWWRKTASSNSPQLRHLF